MTEFATRMQTFCADIGERAYQRFKLVFPEGAAITTERRIEEARLRADATDELVAAAERLVPPTELATRWPGIIAGLVANADHERAMMVALRAGTPEPERPSGLDDFRHLGLGGTCDDWLEMN